MPKGKKPKLFEVGMMYADGTQELKTLPTSKVQKLITRLNDKQDNLVTVVLKKKPKQITALHDGASD